MKKSTVERNMTSYTVLGFWGPMGPLFQSNAIYQVGSWLWIVMAHTHITEMMSGT